jgi:hypothetical protein
MSTQIVEAFSLSHVAILDGATGAEEVDGDVYGVNEASLEPDEDEFQNEGDDTVLSTWRWLNNAELTVQAGYIPFPLIELLYGEPVTSSGTDPNDFFEVEIWTDRGMNIAAKPVLIRMPSKDHLGAVRTLDIVLYRVQFGPITFDGPVYKDGLKVNYSGRALLSTVDETGASLGGYKAVGRLISRPQI